MNKELLELIKTIAGSSETLIIWYMAIQVLNNIIDWVGGVFCMYWLGKGFRYMGEKLEL